MTHDRTLGNITTPTNLVRAEQFETIVAHLFSAIPEDEGNGFSDIRTNRSSSTDARVDRDGVNARLSTDATGGEWASLETVESVNYTPGRETTAGWAMTVIDTPTGDQDLWVGAAKNGNGVGVGLRDFDRGDGSPGATRRGVQAYAFRRKSGDETIVPQEHWNLDSLDGSGEGNGNPSGLDVNLFRDGNVVRIDPLVHYGHVKYRLVAIVKDGNTTQYVPFHSFVVEGESMTDQPNVPLAASVSSGTTDSSVAAKLTAMHIHGDRETADSRETSDHRHGQTVSNTITPLVSYQVRDGWGHINTRPDVLQITTTNPLVVEILVQTDLTDPSFDTPDRVSDDETAIELDTSATGFNDTGEMTIKRHLEGGTGRNAVLSGVDLSFTDPGQSTVTAAAYAPENDSVVDTTFGAMQDF